MYNPNDVQGFGCVTRDNYLSIALNGDGIGLAPGRIGDREDPGTESVIHQPARGEAGREEKALGRINLQLARQDKISGSDHHAVCLLLIY